MDIVALALPLVLFVILVAAFVVLRKEMRRRIWGDEGANRRRDGKRR